MKRALQGARAPTSTVARLIEALLASYPRDLHLLTGVRLPASGTGPAPLLDLVAVTDTAAVVGVEVKSARGEQATSPQAAALAVVRLQRDRLGQAGLPVYACWLGSAAPEGYSGGAPALRDAAALQHFIEQASAQAEAPRPDLAGRLADELLRADLDGRALPQPAPGAPTLISAPPRKGSGGVGRVLRGLRALPGQLDAGLRERLRQPFALGQAQPVRPADVRRRLEAAMFAPDNILEDARYARVVPNEYVVELSPSNYERHYRQIERRVCTQWQEELLEALNTANQRQGRQQYQFGGRVQVSLRPAPAGGLAEDEVRIRCRIAASPKAETAAAGCLELLSNGRRWPLPAGTTTLGRQAGSDIQLASQGSGRGRRPLPLISGQHAYVVVKDGQARLFDGSTAGRPSLNGTFVNGQRVQADGRPLTDGDVVVLAPLDPRDPRPSGPGVIALQYHARCPHE